MRRDPFLRTLLWLCVAVLASSALPRSLVRLSWLGYPLLCALLLIGLSERPAWRTRRAKALFQSIGVASIAAQIIWLLSPRTFLPTGLTLLALLVVFLSWSLLRFILRLAKESPDEGDLVAGGLAGYLMLGIQGGLLLTVIDGLLPGSFRDTATGALVQSPSIGKALVAIPNWDENVQRITYFAFVSLTTVGYGDISPVQPIARLASVALGILGPFYIAVVLGVVVSRYVSEGWFNGR